MIMMNSCQGLRKLRENKGEIFLTDSMTKVRSFKSNKSYNLRIYKSEKIEAEGDVKLLTAIALTICFEGDNWFSMGFIGKTPDNDFILKK